MAKTFYKFAERSADSQINWAEVGKQLSDVVTEETNVRRDRKAAIDDDIASFQDKLNNPPLGEHQGFNDWTTNYAANTQDYALQLERLVKSGKIKTRDYTRMKANLTQGTSDAFDMGTKFQERYAEIVERAKVNPETGKPQSQELEQFLMNSTRAMGNYSNSELYIDPPTGRVLLANYTDKKDAEGNVVMDENGQPVRVLDKDSNSYAPVSQLLNRMDIQVDYYDMDTSLTAAVDGIGTDIQAVVRGGVMTREDALSNDRFSNAVENIVAGQLAIPTNVTSVLTNVLGMAPDSNTPYEYTWDAAQAAANPNLIYVYNDPAQNDSGAPASLFGEDMDAVADTLLRDGAFDLSDAERKDMPEGKALGIMQERRDAFVANARKQYDAAKEVVTDSALSNFDFKETAFEKRPDPVEQQARVDAAAGNEREEKIIDILPEISKLHTTRVDVNAKQQDGTPLYPDGVNDTKYIRDVQAEFDSAESYVQGLNDDVVRVEMNGDDLTIFMSDGDGGVIPLEPINRATLSQEQFIKAIVNQVVSSDDRKGVDIDNLVSENLFEGDRSVGAGEAGAQNRVAPEAPPAAWTTSVDTGEVLSNGKKEFRPVDEIFKDVFDDVFVSSSLVDGEEVSEDVSADNVSTASISLAEGTFLEKAGVSNAAINTGKITKGTVGLFGIKSEEVTEVVSIMIPATTTDALVFPEGLSEEVWATINKRILNARASGETVDINSFDDLGIANLEEINTAESKEQLNLTVVEEKKKTPTTTGDGVSLNANERMGGGGSNSSL
jgi:hypothetical protein